VIEIETEGKQEAKRPFSSGACPSNVIEIDIEGKQEAKRLFSSSKVPIIDTRLPVSHSVVTPVQTRKLETNHLLHFAVSKNSGRVSVHRAETGKSFHFNFDINEIVTKETADALLNAEVKRSSSKAQSSAVPPIDIKFCDDSVKGGKIPSPSFVLVVHTWKLTIHNSSLQSFAVLTLESRSPLATRQKSNAAMTLRHSLLATYPFARWRRKHSKNGASPFPRWR
jgi:hypothetical protein